MPFYDHMLTALPSTRCIDLDVQATGDIDIDAHHTVEDVAIVLGAGPARGARRQGRHPRGSATRSCPLDEALAQAVVDVSGRPYCVHTGEPAGRSTS